jgi:hypothetical protein
MSAAREVTKGHYYWAGSATAGTNWLPGSIKSLGWQLEGPLLPDIPNDLICNDPGRKLTLVLELKLRRRNSSCQNSHSTFFPVV